MTNDKDKDDNNIPICKNCFTSTTPLWRRDESGNVLCNACGLFLKLHGKSRPISLKSSIIKSRNRKSNNNHHHSTNDKLLNVIDSIEIKPKLANTTTLPHLSTLLDNDELPLPIIETKSTKTNTEQSDSLNELLNKQENIIKLKSRITELELVTDLYKKHIIKLDDKCKSLEQQLERLKGR